MGRTTKRPGRPSWCRQPPHRLHQALQGFIRPELPFTTTGPPVFPREIAAGPRFFFFFPKNFNQRGRPFFSTAPAWPSPPLPFRLSKRTSAKARFSGRSGQRHNPSTYFHPPGQVCERLKCDSWPLPGPAINLGRASLRARWPAAGARISASIVTPRFANWRETRSLRGVVKVPPRAQSSFLFPFLRFLSHRLGPDQPTPDRGLAWPWPWEADIVRRQDCLPRPITRQPDVEFLPHDPPRPAVNFAGPRQQCKRVPFSRLPDPPTKLALCGRRSSPPA